MNSLIPSDTEMLRERVSQVERKDDPVYLSLTRTATLSITTAGTIVTWQEEVDSCGKITWSGSTITVPVAGYYHVSVIGSTSLKDEIYGDIVVGGVEVAAMGLGSHKDTKFRLNIVRFFKVNDAVQAKLTTKSGTHTLQVNTEDIASESPIFHMVLL